MHQQQTSNALTQSIFEESVQNNALSEFANTSEAHDADLHARNLTNWQQEYDQLSGGRFYGRIDEIRLDGMQVFKEHTSQSLRQQCNVWPDAIWLGISADAADCRINGLEVADNQIMCRPGACDFELITPDEFDIYGLVIRTDALLAAAENDELNLQGLSLHEHPRLAIPEQDLTHVRELLGKLVNPETPDLHQRLQRDLILRTLLGKV